MEVALTTLVNQFGFVIGMGIAFIGTLLWIARSRASTQDYATRQRADAHAETA
jgi:hypothetical protein